MIRDTTVLSPILPENPGQRSANQRNLAWGRGQVPLARAFHLQGAANPTGSNVGSALTKGGRPALGTDPGPGIMQFFIDIFIDIIQASQHISTGGIVIGKRGN